jgi:hypothetical protein
MSIDLGNGTRVSVDLDEIPTAGRIRKANLEKREENPQTSTGVLTNKKIAAVISIILCICIYFLLLSNCFTTKVDTYVCYIADNKIHDINCPRLTGKQVVESTVHNCYKTYPLCGCDFTNQATVTQKYYILPLLISAPISFGIYVLLTGKKVKDLFAN